MEDLGRTVLPGLDAIMKEGLILLEREIMEDSVETIEVETSADLFNSSGCRYRSRYFAVSVFSCTLSEECLLTSRL